MPLIRNAIDLHSLERAVYSGRLCLRNLSAGYYPGFNPTALPATPGLDGVGKVIKHGPNTAGSILPGQRVVAGPWNTDEGGGTWAQYVTVAEDRLLAIPDSMNDDVACQFPTNPLAVVGILESFPVINPGEWILNVAGASAVGQMITKLSKRRGYNVISTVRRSSQVKFLKSIGSDAVLVGVKRNLAKRVMEITNGFGATLSLDPVGGEGTADVVSSTAAGGQVVMYSAMSDMQASVNISDVIFRNVKVSGFWVYGWLNNLAKGARSRILQETLDLMADGTLVAVVGERYPLEDFVRAIEASNISGKKGKVLLEG